MSKPVQPAKMTVQFTGYKTYVLDADKVLQVMALLKDAEMFESVYHSTTTGGNGKSTYHVYANDSELSQPCNVQFISDAVYALAKITGKPPEKD